MGRQIAEIEVCFAQPKHLRAFQPRESAPMIARVIYFGPDDCHRLTVLRRAGYVVEDCDSLIQLRAVLANVADVDALLMCDSDGVSPREAVAAAQARSPLPVIFFRNANIASEASGYDLVVPYLTTPASLAERR